jgi:hypothetical protein
MRLAPKALFVCSLGQRPRFPDYNMSQGAAVSKLPTFECGGSWPPTY